MSNTKNDAKSIIINVNSYNAGDAKGDSAQSSANAPATSKDKSVADGVWNLIKSKIFKGY